MMGCGRRHYILVTKDNNLLVWGGVFKEKVELQSEGFSFHYGDSLFEGGKITDLEVRYGIFGALVQH